MVADGWPEPMARAGFELHRKTWNPEALAAAFEAELAGFGGAGALTGFVDDRAGRRVKIEPPDSIVHIWPAMPGAGLTPVLFGAFLGAAQWVRPSSRGRRFAEHILSLWPDELAPLELLEPDDDWTFGEVVVVSGSDETVAEVRKRAAGQVTGYGHRVSFAVVVDNDEIDLGRVAVDVATDAVLWRQAGCFSARGVLFCGARERLEAFGELLGQAIAAREARLGADTLDRGALARRAQARGVAEFTGTLWGEGLGWAQLVDGPFAGERPAAHVLTLHRVASADAIADAVAVPRAQLQGVALAAPAQRRADWEHALAELGVTRICRPGQLQAPPAGWLHDGRANVSGWLRVVIAD